MAAKRKPVSRAVAMAALQERANSYAQSLRDRIFAGTVRPSYEFMEIIDPLIVEFSRLRVAFAAHLDGEK